MAAPAIGEAQPRMHDALDALHRAKTSAKPLDDLQSAADSLRHGAHNKKGYRVDALPVVEQAIGALKAGDRLTADKLIDDAINKVEKAVAAGHR